MELITIEKINNNILKAYEHYLNLIIKEIELEKEYCQTKNLIIKELEYYYSLKSSMCN